MKNLIFAVGLTVSSAFAHAPAPDRPHMIIRFSTGEENPEVWNAILPQLAKYRKACDEVWFSNGISMVPLDVHRQRAKLIAKAAEDVRKIGIVPSLQIQATIGHGDNPSLDNRALTWGTYVGRNGEICQSGNCPRQKEFHRYLYEMSKIYAAWRPGSVWIDDDLRLSHHYPAIDGGGCFCADCLAEFSTREKRTYSRTGLLAAFAKDPELEKRWMKFGEEGIAMIAEAIARAFAEVSPETRLGLQHGYAPERNVAMETLYKAGGKRIGSRPGAGTYSDHDPYQIILKGIKISQEIFSQPGYEMLDQIAAEIEDFPRVFSSKTRRGHQLEALFYIAMGCDSLSYYSITPDLETAEFYGEHILQPLAQEAATYREFADHNINTLPGGLGIVKAYPQITELGLPLIGIPFASHSPGACAIMLNPRIVKSLSDEELAGVLDKNLIIDGESAALIKQRGFGDKIGGIRSTRKKAKSPEKYLDVPFNSGIAGKIYSLPSTLLYEFECPENSNIQILSRYKDAGNAPATVLLTRPDNTRVALIGCEGFQTICVSTSRVDFLTRIADWVSGDKLPVIAAEPTQCLFTPRITSDGKLRSVAVINTVIDHQKPLPIKLRGVPTDVTEIICNIPGEKPQILPVTHQDGFACITLPKLEGWQGAWLKI